jgi:hypothetical protein
MIATTRNLACFVVTLFTTSTASPGGSRTTECDVKGVYKTIDAPFGTISLSLGEIQDVEQLLAPASLSSGSYDVNVTRKANNLYRADGTGSYILTRYCYEYAYSQKAVLRYDGRGGTLVFGN